MKRIITMEVNEEDYEEFLKEMEVDEEVIEDAKRDGTIEDIVYSALDDIDPFYSYATVRIFEETY